MAQDLDAIAGSLAGRYRIEHAIGSGGMATVYRAHDVRHDRPVALKVLRPELSAVIGAERFLREIRTTANLQHPHILPLFDSGEAAGLLFYVMPFVAGESLRDRLAREKQLGVEESVRLASEVASALDYAHRQGIVHRDVKPANILLHDGRALVADFGIALAVRNAGADRITETGLSLGTPHYMSPEQATGDRDPDARSDVYSLAAVLYEMLAGEPPHTGSTVQAVIAKVLTEPVKPVGDLRHSVPVHVSLAVERALSKIPADRFDSAAEFEAALHDPAVMMSGAGAGAQPAAATIVRHRVHLAGTAVGAFVAGAAAWWILHGAAPVPDPPVVQFEIMPDSGRGLDRDIPAISHDGSLIAYVEGSGAAAQIVVRPIGDTRARRLAGTDGGFGPFFSPDGSWIGFGSGHAIMKTRLDGGTPINVAALHGLFFGAAWARDGTIFYADWPLGLFRVSADGGEPERVPIADTLAWLSSPSLVEGERAVVAQDARSQRSFGTVLVDLESGQVRPIGQFTGAAFIAPDKLAYAMRNGQVMWQRFDRERGALSGSPILLATDVMVDGGWAFYAASRSGALVYRPAGEASQDLLLVDREGAGTLLVRGRGLFAPRFSPDGRRIAYEAFPPNAQSSEIWIHDIEAGTGQRLTNLGRSARPQWSPDGRRIAFFAAADSGRIEGDLYVQEVDGNTPAAPLLEAPDDTPVPTDWSRDGATIVYTEVSTTTLLDVWSVPALGGQPAAYLVTPFGESGARLSPDGRWVVYQSDETGRYEVYLRSFPTPGEKIAISSDGGEDPAWRGDGRELYYWHGNELVAVSLTPGTPPAVGGRQTLFTREYQIGGGGANYDASSDGQRFVILSPGGSGRIVVMLNAVDGGRR